MGSLFILFLLLLTHRQSTIDHTYLKSTFRMPRHIVGSYFIIRPREMVSICATLINACMKNAARGLESI